MVPWARTSARSAPFEARARRFSVGSPLMRNRLPLGCRLASRAPAGIALLTHHEQQRGGHTGLAQPLSGGQLRSNNPFGVASAPAIEKKIVLAAGNERRHRIHMRGKHHVRLAAVAGIQVEPGTAIAAVRWLGNLRPLHGKAPLLQQGVEIRAHRSLVIGERFDVYQAARQVQGIERLHRFSAYLRPMPATHTAKCTTIFGMSDAPTNGSSTLSAAWSAASTCAARQAGSRHC